MASENNSNDMRDKGRVQAMIDISTYIDNKKLDTYMRNLSCSGIMIVDDPDTDYEPGRECKIAIPLDESRSIELDAKIVWRKDGLVGLNFPNIDESASSNLNQLILRQINNPSS